MRRIIFITDFATVTKQGERLIFRNGKGRWGVPVRYVDMILVSGKTTFSGDAVNLILKEGIPVFFFTRLYRFKGVLTNTAYVRMSSKKVKQLEAFMTRRIHIAKEIVRRKVELIGETFRVDVSEEINQLSEASSVQEIMGIEGRASRKMFERFGENISPSSLRFNGRSYHPPRDEVNALLSLTYTLCYCLAFPLLLFSGYDPFISFLHTGRGTHMPLCSDVIEPVRPVATKLLEEPLLRELFGPKDFSKTDSGYLLKREALPKFLNWFEDVKGTLVERIKDSVLMLGGLVR